MEWDPSSMLEVLRDHLHATEADLVELDAVLSAADEGPGYALVRDYLVDQVRDRLAEGAPLGFDLYALALTHAADHPRLPTAAELGAAFEAASPPRPPQAVRALARASRQGSMELGHTVSLLGTYVRELSPEPRPEEVDAVVECATTVLAVAYASDMVASPSMAEQLCAFLRGVELWNARRHALALFGEAFAMDPGLAHTVFMAFVEGLEQGGEPYLRDRVRGRTIGMREVRFAPLSAFVQVAMPAAAVSDLARHRGQWPAGRLVKVRERLWLEAAELLERCGVELPRTPTDDAHLALQTWASLTGPDGRLAVQCALAAAESLLATGEAASAVRLAGLVRQSLTRLEGPAGYLDWARDVERRSRA